MARCRQSARTPRTPLSGDRGLPAGTHGAATPDGRMRTARLAVHDRVGCADLLRGGIRGAGRRDRAMRGARTGRSIPGAAGRADGDRDAALAGWPVVDDLAYVSTGLSDRHDAQLPADGVTITEGDRALD